jgi:hypothetical protein
LNIVFEVDINLEVDISLEIEIEVVDIVDLAFVEMEAESLIVDMAYQVFVADMAFVD